MTIRKFWRIPTIFHAPEYEQFGKLSVCLSPTTFAGDFNLLALRYALRSANSELRMHIPFRRYTTRLDFREQQGG